MCPHIPCKSFQYFPFTGLSQQCNDLPVLSENAVWVQRLSFSFTISNQWRKLTVRKMDSPGLSTARHAMKCFQMSVFTATKIQRTACARRKAWRLISEALSDKTINPSNLQRYRTSFQKKQKQKPIFPFSRYLTFYESYSDCFTQIICEMK